MKRATTLFMVVAIVGLYAGLTNIVSAAGITSMSVTGTGITANSSAVTTSITPTVNFTTATNLVVDGNTIIITLNGMTVVSGQTLAAADLTLSACTSNTLEASPGTGDNGAHEVSITNGASGNSNPVITITLDSTAGPTAPSCAAGAKTLAVASGQLESHTTAANYAIHIVTTHDTGSFLYYVGDENDVLVTATVDNILSFNIREDDDSADLATAGGPGSCPLGNLGTAGVQTCAYRLNVATNAVSGYYVSVAVDDDLNNDSDTEFIDNTATGSAPTSGVEGYNILLSAGASSESGSGVTVTECTGAASGDCLADSINWSNATGTIFSNTTASVMYDVSGPNSPTSPDTTNTALVTHRAEQDAATPAGNYNQLATYTVIANW